LVLKLTVVDRDGNERELSATLGYSVMETIREGGMDELLALCGGCCSCATCHVFVDPEWAGLVGGPGEDEDDLLESTSSKRSTSRLSCQIEMSEALNGLRVTIAPEE
jgi:2Fe-2S ferredoxin